MRDDTATPPSTAPAEVVRAWRAAVAVWDGRGPPPSLAAEGVERAGGRAPQQRWGPEALADLERPGALAPYLDHTLLRPDATPADVARLGAEAREVCVAGACVHPVHVRVLVEALAGSSVEPVSVVGFPHGAHRTAVKVLEARTAIEDGARAVDVVAPLGALRAGDDATVLVELRALVAAVQPWPVRVILETGLLTAPAVALGAGLALLAGCDAVKTSTGFSGPGARVEDVALLRACVGPWLGVKASGGIRDPVSARALVAAGASRLGTSASLALVRTG